MKTATRPSTRAAVRIGLVGAAVSALALGQALNAQAVNRYTVEANSPKPAACNNHGNLPVGTWLQNKPCGYYVGMAMAGSSYDVQRTNPSGYHFGRNHGNNNICGWIPPGALSDNPTGTAPRSCSESTREALSHRRSFGYNFNARAHEAVDGSPISVNPSCGAYYNYYTTSTYSTGSLRDYAGNTAATVRYRFTTNGSNPAMVVRDDNVGWVFMDRDCVTDWRNVTFHNDND